MYVLRLDQPNAEPLMIDTELPSERNTRHEPAWSPDSSKLAYLKGNELVVYQLSTQERERFPISGIANADQRFLLWSPCGEYIMVKMGYWLVSIDLSGNITSLQTPEGKMNRGILRRSDQSFFYSSDGKSCVLWAVDIATGDQGFYRLPLDGSPTIKLLEESQAFFATTFHPTGGTFSDISADGKRIVFAAEHFFQPKELWLVSPNWTDKQQITNINPELNQSMVTCLEQQLSWLDSRGEERTGMLFIPNSTSPSNLFPLVTMIYPNILNQSYVHSWTPQIASAILPPQLLIAKGYAVFIPEVFVDTNQFREEVTKEPLNAIEQVKVFSEIDIGNQAIMGHSCGGYSVNCIVTKTDVFKAAISSAGVSDLLSAYAMFYEYDDGMIDGFGCQWLETGQMKLGGPPWEHAEKYMDNSPLLYLDKVNTPLLLVGGGEDPLYKPEGMLVGLERLEKKVTCLRYEGEGHTPLHWSIANRIDIAERVFAWLEGHIEV